VSVLIMPVDRLGPKFGALICVGILLGSVWTYPLGGIWLAIGLLVYLAFLIRWPHCWVSVLPAALPVLDLTPWTGRFFFDELDCLLAATVAVNCWRSSRTKWVVVRSRAVLILLALLGSSYLASIAIGVYPLPSPGLNSFNNYFSPYNALRAGKGAIWALLLLPSLIAEFKRDAAEKTELTQRRLAWGMTCGVLAASIGVLWERAAFPGWLNYYSGYRVVGLFSEMHTGGAYIEAYFTAALPFAAWWALGANTHLKRVAGAIILIAGAYALAVSYARGGYLAFVTSMSVLVLGLIFQKRAQLKSARVLHGLLLLSLLAAIAQPVMQGTAMQRRYAASQRDWHTRERHWSDALQMMNGSINTKLFGMGLGSYPRTYDLASSENVRSSRYELAREGNNTYLLLTASAPLYIEQIIHLRENTHYRLSFVARNQVGNSELLLPICEKWMLYSANCIWQSAKINSEKWQTFTFDFYSGVFPSRPWYARRPFKFSMFNNAESTVLAIDNISITAEDGAELLSNGNFNAGMDRWFFTSDNHLPWHLENLWLQIYFEQGAFGLLSFFALAIIAAGALIKQFRANDHYAVVLASSLAAFLTLAMFDSLFDFPRMSLLFYLLIIQVLIRNNFIQSVEPGKLSHTKLSKHHEYGMDGSVNML
jgi:O-antigen ligase